MRWTKLCQAAPVRRAPNGEILSRRLAETRGTGISLYAELFYEKPAFVRRIIAHELTHALDFTQGLSRDPSFLEINGWRNKPGLVPWKSKDPRFNEGSYRSQGDQNPKEDLGTAAEGYFGDPQFRCNFPAMYLWFKRKVGPTQVRPAACPELQAPVSPQKLSGLQYVFTSAYGKQIESRLGHALLLIQSRGEDPVSGGIFMQAVGGDHDQTVVTGLESPEEVTQKIAQLQKEAAQAGSSSRLPYLWRGLTGQFDMRVLPTQFQLYYLQTVVGEGRDLSLVSVPIEDEDRETIAYILNQATHHAWGSYSIRSNNCATMIARLIDLILTNKAIRPSFLGVYTPKGVLNQLKKLDAAQGKPVDTQSIRGYTHGFQDNQQNRLDAVARLKASPRFSDLSMDALGKKRVDPSDSKIADTLASELDAILDRVKSLRTLSPEESDSVGQIGFVFGFSHKYSVQSAAQALVNLSVSNSPGQ